MANKFYRQKLTKMQFDILEILNDNKPKPVNIETLSKLCKNSTANLLVHICFLRKRLKHDLLIKNYRGKGYALEKGGW